MERNEDIFKNRGQIFEKYFFIINNNNKIIISPVLYVILPIW